MTDPVQEQLSACLDNELPQAELDLLLKRLERDPQLPQALGRYALIGEALRNERPIAASADFAARVSAALGSEQVHSARRASFGQAMASQRALRFLKPAAGLAVAAGVAAAAIIAVRPAVEPTQLQLAAQQAPARSTSAVQSASAAKEEGASYIVPATTSTAFIPATRLTNYVVAHSEYAAPLGRLTVLNGVLAEDEAAAADADAEVDVNVSVPSP